MHNPRRAVDQVESALRYGRATNVDQAVEMQRVEIRCELVADLEHLLADSVFGLQYPGFSVLPQVALENDIEMKSLDGREIEPRRERPRCALRAAVS